MSILFRQYFTNTLWVMAEKMIRIGLLLLTGALIARYLGPGDYGLLSFSFSVVILFSAIANLGLDEIVVRELVRSPAQKDALLGTVFRLKLLGALFAVAAIVLTVHFSPGPRDNHILIFVMALGLFFQSFNVIDFYFQSKVISKYTVWAQFSQMIVLSLFRLSLIYFKAPLIWFALAFLLDSVILALNLTFIYHKQNTSFLNWRFEKSLAKSLLQGALPVLLTGLIISVYMRIDQIIIKAVLGNAAVGQYAVAVSFCEVWYFIPVAITASFFPSILNAKNEGELSYYIKLQKLYDLMVILAFGIAILVTIFAPIIIHLFFGPQFQAAINVLRVYVWVMPFVFLGVANSKWFLAENLQDFLFYRAIPAGVISIVLNLLLVPKFGIEAAAYIAVISFAVAGCFSMTLFKECRDNFSATTRSFNVFASFKRLLHL